MSHHGTLQTTPEHSVHILVRTRRMNGPPYRITHAEDSRNCRPSSFKNLAQTIHAHRKDLDIGTLLSGRGYT